ncbi:MAG TPA: flagellar motor switch protein FliM, partial [Alphaproteobacteria bacterium]
MADTTDTDPNLAAAASAGGEGDTPMSDEEKAMMAEWEAMASSALGVDGQPAEDDIAAAMEGGDTRILNQDEIDSL